MLHKITNKLNLLVQVKCLKTETPFRNFRVLCAEVAMAHCFSKHMHHLAALYFVVNHFTQADGGAFSWINNRAANIRHIN